MAVAVVVCQNVLHSSDRNPSTTANSPQRQCARKQVPPICQNNLSTTERCSRSLQKPHLCFRKLKVTKLDLYYAVLISVLTWFVFIDILIVFAALTREMLFLPLEHEIHIFSPPCNILRVCCNNHFYEYK